MNTCGPLPNIGKKDYNTFKVLSLLLSLLIPLPSLSGNNYLEFYVYCFLAFLYNFTYCVFKL